MEPMETTLRKTFKYKLKPTPEQERLLDRTLMFCRHVYNAAIGERLEAWRLRGITVSYYQQKAELPGIKEAMPEYAEVYSQALQDVIQRVDRAFKAFFRRLKAGETPGYPRFHGVVPATIVSPILRLETMVGRTSILGFSFSPKSGASRCAGHTRWRECPRRSPSGARPTGGMPVSPVPMCQYIPYRLPTMRQVSIWG